MVDLVPDKTVDEFGLECAGPGVLVWLEDAGKPLDPSVTLAVAGVDDLSHLHISHCKDVFVKVRYNGNSVEGRFSPAMTVAPIFKWATGPEGFKLTDNESAQHHFAVCGTQTGVDEAEHIGCLADEDGEVCVDLVPNDRFAG